jgi:hypothetical protein
MGFVFNTHFNKHVKVSEEDKSQNYKILSEEPEPEHIKQLSAEYKSDGRSI